MRTDIYKYYQCLFNFDDFICATVSPKGTSVYALSQMEKLERFTYVSINPLLGDIDLNPTENWHQKDVPRRADVNVTRYRNILVEMDTVDLDTQVGHMARIEFPFSTCVFSGKKSYHWIVSLETPLETRKEYNALVKRVYAAVGLDLVDETCKNPSRLSRAPGHIRKDTGQEQYLDSVRGRIPNQVLDDWLISRGQPKEISSDWEDITYKRAHIPKDISSLSGTSRNFLMGVTSEQWNITLFKTAADLCRNGWNIEEAQEELIKVTGTLDANDYKTIKSAFSNELNKIGEINGQKA